MHGISFKTVEHYIAFRKAIMFAKDNDVIINILNVEDAKEVLSISKDQTNFENFNAKIWDNFRTYIMFMALVLKVYNSQIINDTLQKWGENLHGIRYEITDNPFWGVGSNGEGENMMGKLYYRMYLILLALKKPSEKTDEEIYWTDLAIYIRDHCATDDYRQYACLSKERLDDLDAKLKGMPKT
jgi:predicted NAD-dependent protein-ADP-ribosyltransferase YbiA (DUF1768 family)